VTVAPVEGLHSVVWWMLGNLEPASRELLVATSGIILVAVVAVWTVSTELNALSLGREMAHHVGVRTRLVLPLALGIAALLASAAVSMSGLIGFVGLIIPHVMRGVGGADHRRLVPAAAVAGGVFLAVCDAVARTVIAPREIPVGVVTALCGGPFFLALLMRKRRQGWIA
jgi:iron complex transport system permease protein